MTITSVEQTPKTNGGKMDKVLRWADSLSKLVDSASTVVSSISGDYKTIQEAQEIRTRVQKARQEIDNSKFQYQSAHEEAMAKQQATHEETMARIENERQAIVKQDNANKDFFEQINRAFDFFSAQYSEYKSLEDMLTAAGREHLKELNTIIHDLMKEMMAHIN